MEVLNLSQLAEDVFNGNENPLKAYGIAKSYMDNAKQALEAIYEAAIDEASKHPENTFEDSGFQFTKKSGSKRFDFKHLEEWKTKKDELAEIEKKYKAAFNSFQNSLTAVSQDGEVMELPKVTQGKDSLSIKRL